MYPVTPSRAISSTRSFPLSAVSMMTGIAWHAGSRRSAASASRPSITGMVTSRRIRSGRWARAAATPSSPFAASSRRQW